MNTLDHPLFVFMVALALQSLAVWIGASFLGQRLRLEKETRENFGVIQAATLTLLGLIVGFSFSMAIGRYDQRKNYEEAEANAIGTEYVRAGLLPRDAAKIRAQLRDYLDQRIRFYVTRDERQLRQIDSRTAKLQSDMWAVVEAGAGKNPTPVVALAVAGMNDVLNSQGYTQAAWWNRIPVAAWVLMLVIAICCNLLVGAGARNPRQEKGLLLILPFVVSIAFLLIADIDSPRGGLIRVKPQNLMSLAGSLRGP